jgi:hypothetical protein
MRVYRFAANVMPRQGLTPTDALAVAVSAIDALTIVERSEDDHPAPGVWTVLVDFQGLNDNEAAETTRRTMAALIGSGWAADAPSLVSMSLPYGKNRVPLP